MRVRELEIDLGDARVTCTAADLAETLGDFLREMRPVARRLRPDERDVLRVVMASENGSLTVGEVFPGFARESEGHRTLRRMRAAQLVHPATTGRWDPEERIEVKPLARLLWGQLGEARFFDEPEAEPEPDDARGVIDLAAEPEIDRDADFVIG